MGAAGRPPKENSLRERARALIAARELSDHQIARELGISHTTVARWRRQLAGPPGARLRPGERRLEKPIRCSEGHLITIVPCRTCRTRSLIAGERAAQEAGLMNSPENRRRAKQPRPEPSTPPAERWTKPPGWHKRKSECRERKRRRGGPGT